MFDYWIIDDFLPPDILKSVQEEFPDFDSDIWHQYNNPIEVKKTCNNWNSFPQATYKLFHSLCDRNLIERIEDITQLYGLIPDYGLHGGGWHCHRRGGKLNLHQDYSMHPKLNRERKLNLILYLTPDWQEEWGGHLELWEGDETKPSSLFTKVLPKENRAVIFDTTQNSWHGLPEPLNCPEGVYRKSIAVYYLQMPKTAKDRQRALFYPHKDQLTDQRVLDLIDKRSNVGTSSETYRVLNDSEIPSNKDSE